MGLGEGRTKRGKWFEHEGKGTNCNLVSWQYGCRIDVVIHTGNSFVIDQLSGSYWTDGVKHGRNWTWKSTQQEIMTSLINPDLISYNHTQECLQFGRETQHGVSPDRHFYLDNKPCAERFFTICEYSLA